MDFSTFLQNNQLSANQILIWAMIPFREDGFFDEYYDWKVTKIELEKVFSELGLEWHWMPVTLSGVLTAVETVCTCSGDKLPLVLNYCDGDEINGFPGLSVVKELEMKGIAFTGADSRFYEISTSKIWMKRLLQQNGVPTSPFAEIIDLKSDIIGLCSRLGAPLFVKPAVSAGAWGITLKSVVNTDNELGEQIKRLQQGLHGKDFSTGGIFAEQFIDGPEFTVFLVGSANFPEHKRVYPPLERIFHQIIPSNERFVTYGRNWNWDQFSEEVPLTNGKIIFEEKLANPSQCEMLESLAWKAHCAVYGTGYSRVDIRIEKATGQAYVLEVNANCSLSSPEDDTSTGYILGFIKQTFSRLIGEILADGLWRYFSKN